MKKYILLSALSLAMLGWSACQEENEAALNVAPNGKSLTFTASVSGSNSLSKTAVAANGRSIVFAEGEQMTVFPNVGGSFTISNSADDVNSFSGVAGDEAYFNATSFVAMYPSGGRDNGDLVMFVPEAQNVVSGSFDSQANLLIAETSSKDMTLQMHNVCSYIKVNISAEASFITVTADQPLAGKVSVSADGSAKMLKGEDAVTLSGNITPGTYYIAVMPGKFTNLKITTDNDDIKPIEVAEFDFEAGHVYGLGIEAEVKLLSPADIVDYVNASDEEIVTLNMALETYDHTEVMLEIEKITDKKVKLVIPEGVKEFELDYVKLPTDEDGCFVYPNPSALVDVVIPDGVTEIGYFAFCQCSSLTSITIPEGVTEIGNYAFDGCSSLTSITIPEGVTEIGNFAFYQCSSLTSITIPEGVTTIGGYAFIECRNLISVTIPEGVTEIPSLLFYNCEKLTNVSLPESVTSIGNCAFTNCTNLASIYIPDGVTRIGGTAFSYCTSLTSLTIPKGVTALEEGICDSCTSLSRVIIHEGVTSISARVFQNCSSLTSIVLPEGIRWIYPDLFAGCSSLTSITIPESVVRIYDSAFDNCDNLETIYCSQAIYDEYHETYPQMRVEGVDNSYTQITFQKQYAAMNFTPENDYSIVIFEFEEQPYEVQVTITSDLFEKEESWGDAYYAAYFPSQYYLNGNTIRLNLNDVFYDNFAGLVNDWGETASKISTVAIQSTADGENVVYLKSVTFVKNDGSTVVLKNSEDGFDFEMEEIK